MRQPAFPGLLALHLGQHNGESLLIDGDATSLEDELHLAGSPLCEETPETDIKALQNLKVLPAVWPNNKTDRNSVHK